VPTTTISYEFPIFSIRAGHPILVGMITLIVHGEDNKLWNSSVRVHSPAAEMHSTLIEQVDSSNDASDLYLEGPQFGALDLQNVSFVISLSPLR
jgi:hypothetical protein